MNLAEFLKVTRCSKNLTLRDVEKLTDFCVSNAYISQLENGHCKEPSIRKLNAIGQAYGVGLDVLTRLVLEGFK